MRKGVFVAVAVVMLIGSTGYAQEVAEPATVEQLGYVEQAERFMDLVTEGSYREAVDRFFAESKWMPPDTLSSLKAQMSGLNDLLGTLHGYDLVVEQHFGESFVYLLYMAKFDRSPVSFHLAFYKPTDHWMAYSMEYQEDLLALAKELGQAKLTMPALMEAAGQDEEAPAVTPTVGF